MQNNKEKQAIIIAKTNELFVNNITFTSQEDAEDFVTSFETTAEVLKTELYNKLLSVSFKSNNAVTSFKIPEGVTIIAPNTFKNCAMLEEITLPSTLTAIEEGAFSNCISLRTIRIPGSVKTIGTEAFYNCAQLQDVILEKGIESIGYKAFASCQSLLKINLPNSLQVIKDFAFIECKSLKEIIMPKSVLSIGRDIFWHANPKLIIKTVLPGQISGWDSVWHRNRYEDRDYVNCEIIYKYRDNEE